MNRKSPPRRSGDHPSGGKSVARRCARGFETAAVWIAAAWAAACGDGHQVTDPATRPNRGPQAVGTIPAVTVSVGESAIVDVSAYFSDPDGDALAYTANSSNDAAASASVSGASVVVTAHARGIVTVTVMASDSRGLIAQQRFQATVPNRGPEAADEIPAQTLFAGQAATVDASAWFSDPDGDALRYSATSSRTDVAAVAVSEAEIAIRGLAPGVAMVTVRASDVDGASVERMFEVTVPNRAPEPMGTIQPLTLAVGDTATVDVSAFFTDPDGESLSFTAASSNAAVADVSAAGDSVTVTAVTRGLVTVTVTARDPQSEVAQQSFQVTVPNRVPEVVGTIPSRTLSVGETAVVDVSAHFTDADGDALSYSAASSNGGVAAASASGSVVTLRAVAPGDATVTIKASDPGGLSVSFTLGVSVVGALSGFQIELVFATSLTEAQEAAFRAAAERWMTILAPTDLPDVAPNRTLGCRGDPRFARDVEMIDDLMIVAVVEEIDGSHGTLARAGPCRVRDGSLLPFYGSMTFDAADLERIERRGKLEDLILHEMGHVLGIGVLWGPLGLLRNPASESEEPDTHFTGPLAVEAFDEAGGGNYVGAKVPVENRHGPGTWNGHWRQAVLVTELMTGFANPGPEPLSAITVQSLADLGYLVDLAAVDPYGLPDADAARAVEDGERIPYGDDIRRGPIVVVDDAGRIVRVIQRQ
ncbi:Ig-like domain-containing protein [Candidatus Palauibacter sp.]|uniref:Ig-like domain-containing protein n=1 Tax=Candidatus Palauibacter sp. TaxID=3101350 RepID=UPI003B52C5AD